MRSDNSINWESNIVHKLKYTYKNNDRIDNLLVSEESITNWLVTDYYINLVILKKQKVEEKEKRLREDQKIRDERVETYESLHEEKEAISIDNLFDKRNGKEVKKIAIYGRAGVGKSTLCQHIAVKWSKEELWTDKFKAVIWLPLRKIVYDVQNHGDQEKFPLAKIIRDHCIEGREGYKPKAKEIDSFIGDLSDVLFILDGYDEVASMINDDKQNSLISSIKETLSDPNSHIIITSRTTTRIPSKIANKNVKIDEELENIGFTNQDIKSYVTKFKPSESESIIKFLESNRNILGIAHIPINLELICYAWQGLNKDNNYTMSKLYKTICGMLLKKYLAKKNHEKFEIEEDEVLGVDELQGCEAVVLDLERLAYEGMQNNEIIILRKRANEILGKAKVEEVLKTGIVKPLGKDIHFLHLTFQEYFAARYVAKGIKNKNTERHEQTVQLLREHKYSPYYEVMWWYVAGVLYDRCNSRGKYAPLMRFWHILESAPRELVGLTHVNLQIRCLDECEVSQEIEIHNEIFKKIKKWLGINVNNQDLFHLINIIHVINTLKISNNIKNKVISELIKILDSNQCNNKVLIASILSEIAGGHLEGEKVLNNLKFKYPPIEVYIKKDNTPWYLNVELDCSSGMPFEESDVMLFENYFEKKDISSLRVLFLSLNRGEIKIYNQQLLETLVSLLISIALDQKSYKQDNYIITSSIFALCKIFSSRNLDNNKFVEKLILVFKENKLYEVFHLYNLEIRIVLINWHKLNNIINNELLEIIINHLIEVATESLDSWMEINASALSALSQLGLNIRNDKLLARIIVTYLENHVRIGGSMLSLLEKAVIGQEELAAITILNYYNKIKNNEKPEKLKNLIKVLNYNLGSVFTLYCFQYSSDQLWLEYSFGNFLETHSNILINKYIILVRNLGRLYSIPLTKDQIQSLLMKFKKSAEEIVFTTEVYEHYLEGKPLGFYAELLEYEKKEAENTHSILVLEEKSSDGVMEFVIRNLNRLTGYPENEGIISEASDRRKNRDASTNRDCTDQERKPLNIHKELQKIFAKKIDIDPNNPQLEERVAQMIVAKSKINTQQVGASFNTSIRGERVNTTLELRFSSVEEFKKFLNYYKHNFPGLVIDTNLTAYNPQGLTGIKMDSYLLLKKVDNLIDRSEIRKDYLRRNEALGCCLS